MMCGLCKESKLMNYEEFEAEYKYSNEKLNELNTFIIANANILAYVNIQIERGLIICKFRMGIQNCPACGERRIKNEEDNSCR